MALTATEEIKLREIIEWYYNLLATDKELSETDVISQINTAIASISQGAGTAYATRAAAMAESPLPADDTPFIVTNEAGFNGQYRYDSSEGSGYALIKLFREDAADGETLENSEKSFTGNQIFTQVQSEITDAIVQSVTDEETARQNADTNLQQNIDTVDAKATEAKTKTDNIVNVEDDKFGIADNNGNLIFEADGSGASSTKFNIKDGNGNVLATLTAQVIVDAINGALVTNNFNPIVKYLKDFIVTDDNDTIGLSYTVENGLDAAKLSAHFKSLLPTASASVALESSFNGDYVMHIFYGQSLAIGGSTVSAEDFLTAKMFSTGVLINHAYADTTEANNETTQEARFVSIADMDSTGNGLNGRYITKLINQLIASENSKNLENFNHNQFGFVAGVSGGQWYQLTKWNEPRTTQWVDVQANTMPTALAFGGNSEGRSYLNLMQGIYFANKFAKAQGKKLTVGSLSYIQGEASNEKTNTISQFKAKLNALFDDIKADVSTITGQSNAVKFITYQNASFALYNDPNRPEWTGSVQYTEGVPLAMVEIAKDRADTIFGATLYPISPTVANTGDLIHLSNLGYAMMASMLGVKAKQEINNADTPLIFEPITANIETWQSGSNWYTYIPFNVEVKPLVLDTTGNSGVNMLGHGLQPNYGFSILNGSSTEIITNVALSSDDAIVITTNENPTGLDLTYAITGAMGGGNLRDSQGDTITTEFNGTTYPLHNWCPVFRITL